MKQQYEEYLEYQARIIINKLSKIIESIFVSVRIMLNSFSNSMQEQKKNNLLSLGIYYPIGLLFLMLGIILLFSVNQIFSPDYIVYFFLSVFFVGIYLHKSN